MPRVDFRGRLVTNDGDLSLNDLGSHKAMVGLGRANAADTNSPYEVCNKIGEGGASDIRGGEVK
jgi:hypothetical protein